MKKNNHYLLLLLLVLVNGIIYSQKATLRGIILDENNQPIPNVNIVAGTNGTQSNENGFYMISLPAGQKVLVQFTHITFKKTILTLQLKDGEDFEFNPVMRLNIEQIDEIVVTASGRKFVEGILNISPETIRQIPGANPGVENILRSLPGVNSNNELSTQYSVRGGNFDENLVYVNEIEVYRPFLIRSGQQEGFSFVNTDLVQNVDFSAGGFQARYGDRLSSVLDVTYKVPVSTEVRLHASLLGATAALETVSPNGKLSTVTGVRYRNNSLFVNSTQTESDFTPVFADAQTYFTYKANSKLLFNFLGYVSVNDYLFRPRNRQTNFGTLAEPRALIVFYDGQEKDQYLTSLGALKATYFVNDSLQLKLIGSAFHTAEEEHFDILARYRLGEVNSNIGDDNLGEVAFSEGVGAQFSHARNDLDALILNFEHKGTYTKNGHQWDWGIKYTREDIRDRLREYQIIDSAGFSLRPPLPEFNNDQPYEPFDAPLEAFQSVRALNFVTTNRFSGFLQWSRRKKWRNHLIWMNAGVRAHSWNVRARGEGSSTQTVISPRAQFAIKPDWETDMVFRVATGLYHQPPFYRELRDLSGNVHPDVKAQQAFHLVLGNEYSFTLWDRPFKLISEGYYKNMTNVNTYTIENVRIRYRADNNATAFAYGLDVRMNGEFVPGTESWISLGFMKTEENINNRGYIARPTDQRFKFAILFQDYVPTIPDLKMYLNLVYNTGLPAGTPAFGDPYDFQNRLRDYRRADLGVSYVLADRQKTFRKGHWLHPFKELSVGIEIFNIFDNLNSITSTFVRDVQSGRQFGIPNFLTGRVLNVKLSMQL
ncbi:TonB-dependent receptor [Ascidiimonas aurantiaca]|uniref:TonB-dependent receptor n=1 Tax=Ascidiimonas aurantiaca TaxID=1685432 RepID=UPI0030EDE610